MEQKIAVFKNKELGSVRTLNINGEPWFIGKDVAEILGYTNPQKAIRVHVETEDKGVNELDTPGGRQELIIINESGLYSLILSSKKATAKAFKRWITSEVLPSIRKHGAYITPDKIAELLTKPKTIIQLLEVLKNEQEQNRRLKQTNKALAMEALTLDDRQACVKLIRKHAAYRGNSFALSWNVFYKNLLYSAHINVKSRHTRAHGVGSVLDYIKPWEWPKALQIAVAMCEGIGIDTSEIIAQSSISAENDDSEKRGCAG